MQSSDQIEQEVPQQTANKSELNFIIPDSGTVFFEHQPELKLCKPHLMPLKSVTLEKLEGMQKRAYIQMQEIRTSTATTSH